MLATLIIEFGLAAYAIWRYKLNITGRLVVLLLVGLASFQLAEYNVCAGGANREAWSRFGFAAITALPPLGLHLMHVLAGKPKRQLVRVAYATMLAFMMYFLAYTGVFTGDKCTGNYVIFQLTDNATGLFSIYYYGWLATALVLGARWANQLMRGAKSQAQQRQLQAVRGLIVGYLVFLLPTGITNTINPETIHGIPSIMCGFAVLLALILGLYILPRAGQPRRKG